MSEGSSVLAIQAIRALPDDELLQRLVALLKAARRVEAVLVAHIGEVDARRLYRREASPSMFAYCTETLQLSEHEAYLRITVARASRGHPLVLAMLADGRLHLSGIAKLVPHLTVENAASLLQRASGRSKQQIEELVATIAPLPDAPSLVRRVPRPQPTDLPMPASVTPSPEVPCSPSSAVPQAAGRAPAPLLRPLSPDRYRIQFTASAALCSKLDRLRDLLRRSIPDGSIEAILDRAVTDLVGRLEARRFGLTIRPHERGLPPAGNESRHIPSGVRRAVCKRDEGRCRFVGANGLRCAARRRLEFHHVEPHARGGAASLANIQLMCRTHNAYLAERDFGAAHMDSFRKGAPSRPPPAAPSRA